MWLSSHYTVHYSTDGSDTDTPTQSQLFYGVSVGANIWFNDAVDAFRWGLTVKLGAATPYQSPSGFQGQPTVSLNVGILFGF